ncbi:hypothetical protein [Pontibacter mangrovi]|uniref:Uncharacterized protein n=1 Tax=Pontibacter mangrovi TaxID=2589816 RepID=A0A501W1N1_9BACT|nr:hypothetical protein [Pontibacter mangrovi]TPE43529.1 hypothetical protein FJM65_12290 [Pontibacter mangrovi]
MFIKGSLNQVNRKTIKKVALLVVLSAFMAYLFTFGLFYRSVPYTLFWVSFLLNGLCLVILFFSEAFSACRERKAQIVMVWGLSMAGFIIVFTPFMATRHVLLLLPPLLVLGGYLYRFVSGKTVGIAVTATFLLGLALSISDWVYADFYRRAATKAAASLPPQASVWSVGHWGWQWYSKQAGMKGYEYNKSTLNKGDFLVSPEAVSKQHLPPDLRLTKVKSIRYPSSFWNIFTTAYGARFYYSSASNIPWYLSVSSVDSVTIYRVRAPH